MGRFDSFFANINTIQEYFKKHKHNLKFMIKSCSSGCYDSTHKRLQNKRTTRCYGKLYRLCYATRYVEKAELLSHQLAPRIAAVMPRNTLKAKRGPGNTVHYAVDSIHIIQNKSTFYIIIYALHFKIKKVDYVKKTRNGCCHHG